MTFISRQYINDNDIVALYLADKLSDVERERFEAYYLEHPEILQELNRTAQFKSGLIDLQETSALENLVEKRSWNLRAGTIAVAASLVLVAIGASIWIHQRDRPILAASVAGLRNQFQSTLPISASINIQRTRTSSYDAAIRLPASPAAIELHVKPEFSALPARYRIDLAAVSDNGATTQIASLKALQPSRDGFVAIFLNVSELMPAIYELKILGDTDTNAAKTESSFLIEVLAAN